jgi:hypothetical protein
VVTGRAVSIKSISPWDFMVTSNVAFPGGSLPPGKAMAVAATIAPATLTMVEDAGHMPMLEQPGENDGHSQFLERG